MTNADEDETRGATGMDFTNISIGNVTAGAFNFGDGATVVGSLTEFGGGITGGSGTAADDDFPDTPGGPDLTGDVFTFGRDNWVNGEHRP